MRSPSRRADARVAHPSLRRTACADAPATIVRDGDSRTAGLEHWMGRGSGWLTFRDLVCAKLDIAPAQFEAEVLARCCFPHARYGARGCGLLGIDVLAVDRAFVRSLGRVRSVAEFEANLDDFQHFAENRHWLRRQLKLRLSVRRLRALARRVVAEWGDGNLARTAASRAPLN